MQYLFVAHGERGEPAILTVCKNRDEVLAAVKQTVWMEDAEFSAAMLEEADGYTSQLMDDGWVKFEGDPPLQLIAVTDESVHGIQKRVHIATVKFDKESGEVTSVASYTPPPTFTCSGCGYRYKSEECEKYHAYHGEPSPQ